MPFGRLYYRHLEKEKKNTLKNKKSYFNGKLGKPNVQAEQELQWWLHHIPKASKDKVLPEVDFNLTTDTTETELGATDGFSPTGDRWKDLGKHHINYL